MNKNNLRNVSSKIRKSRRVLNLSQAELSKKLDISPSYLNLIESGKRPITVPLLIKLGNILGISLKDLTPEENQHLLSDVMDTLSNEMFNDVDITNIEVSDFVSNNPNLARALLILSDNHRNLSEDIQNRLEKIDVDSISKKNIELSARNIINVKLVDTLYLSAYDILKYDQIIFTKSSTKELEKRLLNNE